MKFKAKYLFIVALVLGLGWMIKDSFLQPGTTDLKGNFEEITFIRNEQNTGPVVRIYSVAVDDTLWTEMEKYGNLMPHTKYGTTRVYFFKRGTPVAEKLSVDGDNIPEEQKKYCLARYEKNTMSQTYLSKYPFTR